MNRNQLAVIGSIVLLLGTNALIAEEKPPAFVDFSPKFVKAGPKKSARSRLPQIDVAKPEPKSAAAAAKPAEKDKNGAVGRYPWFWAEVSPELTEGSAGRIDNALSTLARSSQPVPAPRLATLKSVSDRHGVDILASTVGTRVSPALVLAVIMVESAGDPQAVSRAGAQGLMQLMPETAKSFGVDDPFEPRDNIAGGVRFLDWLMNRFDGDPMLVLAGYNAGPGAVRDHQGVPPYAETRDYVPKVLAAFKIARGLCQTPPQLASDGCVFANLGS